MNRAKSEILGIIRKHGRITVEEFFRISTEYYYNSKDPFGVNGDFTTAPEISQLFGEIVGVWVASVFMQNGMPRFCLVEMGAGRGTLINDVLRATKNFKGFADALEQVYIIENSDYLFKMQQNKLTGKNVTWVKSIHEIKSDNCIFICNELFDALPFKQFINSKERGIILKDGELTFDSVNEEGAVTEVSDASLKLCEEIKRISIAALIIDYGYFQAPGVSTLQAVRAHEKVGVFDFIGEADLTYHVDFEALSTCLPNSKLFEMRQFLKDYGIEIRAAKLVEAGYDLGKIQTELDRLLSTQQMGALFKVLEYIK